MSKSSILQPGVTALGEALRPMLSELQTQLDARVRSGLRVSDAAGEVADHLDEMADTLSGLTAKVNTLGELLSREAPVAEIHRAAGGLEVHLDALLARYSEVRRWRPGVSDLPARDLLAGVYRHLLTEIRSWMEELVEVIGDPLAAVKRRGLPTSGYVELPINLTLTEAPQLAELHDWLVPGLRGAGDDRLPPAPARKSGLGFCGTVAAAVLGFAIGDWLFGGEEEE